MTLGPDFRDAFELGQLIAACSWIRRVFQPIALSNSTPHRRRKVRRPFTGTVGRMPAHFLKPSGGICAGIVV
jgi:hypothetical protein